VAAKGLVLNTGPITKRARGGEVTRLDLYRALAASMSPYNTYSDLI